MITRANLTQEICSHAYAACRRVRPATEYPLGKGNVVDITFESVDWKPAVVLAAAGFPESEVCEHG